MLFLKHVTPRFLARATAISLFAAVLGGRWDVWWHTTIGRDTFWEPPHILIYGSVTFAILLGIAGFLKTKAPEWKRIAGFLAIAPLLGPFDELWHKWFGVENLTSPWIVWAIPHVLLIVAVATALVLTLPILRREENDESAKRVFGAMIFAALLNLGLILVIPLNPFGPYHLLGFFGSVFTAFLISFLLLSSEKWIGGFAPTFLVVAFFLTLYLVGFEGREPINPTIVSNPHPYVPAWLVVFSYIIPAFFIGMSGRFRLPFRGMMIGLLWGCVLYGFAGGFFELAMKYDTVETAEAILSAIIGGAIGALLFAKIIKA